MLILIRAIPIDTQKPKRVPFTSLYRKVPITEYRAFNFPFTNRKFLLWSPPAAYYGLPLINDFEPIFDIKY
jgi:hypothetical protein